jgi:hypothetical protein
VLAWWISTLGLTIYQSGSSEGGECYLGPAGRRRPAVIAAVALLVAWVAVVVWGAGLPASCVN